MTCGNHSPNPVSLRRPDPLILRIHLGTRLFSLVLLLFFATGQANRDAAERGREGYTRRFSNCMFRPRPRISFVSTSKLAGVPASSVFSPLTIDS